MFPLFLPSKESKILKGFWLNFVLTFAICLSGLYSVNVIADLVEEVELVAPQTCWKDVNKDDCGDAVNCPAWQLKCLKVTNSVTGDLENCLCGN